MRQGCSLRMPSLFLFTECLKHWIAQNLKSINLNLMTQLLPDFEQLKWAPGQGHIQILHEFFPNLGWQHELKYLIEVSQTSSCQKLLSINTILHLIKAQTHLFAAPNLSQNVWRSSKNPRGMFGFKMFQKIRTFQQRNSYFPVYMRRVMAVKFSWGYNSPVELYIFTHL